MFPILFRIPDAFQLSSAVQAIELSIGVLCLLGWLACLARKRNDLLAGVLNMGAFLVLLHFALSWLMKGEITIYSFGVMIIIAFFGGSTYLVRQTRQLGLDDKKVFDWAFWMLVVGVIASRIFYAYIDYDAFRGDKLRLLRVWEGGLVWYGGLIPAAVVGVWLLRKWKMPVLHVADSGAAAVILALGIGRWACFLAGDDYGRVTDSWLGIRFYNADALVPELLRGQSLHATQMYMSVNCLWIFFVTEWVRRKARYAGQAFATMLILYAVTRAVLIEPFRGDFAERNPGYHRHLALPIVIDKEEGSPAVHLERGAKVTGVDGRTGEMLEDLVLPEGEGVGVAYAISDEALARDPNNPRVQVSEYWRAKSVEGLPEGVPVQSDTPIPYGSFLPVPPAYVSTSQWISIGVVLAGIALLLASRKRDEEGFTAAVERRRREASDDASD